MSETAATGGSGFRAWTNLVVALGLAIRCAFLNESIGTPPWFMNWLDGCDMLTHLKAADGIFLDPWLRGQTAPFYQSPLYPYVLAGLQHLLGQEPVRIAYAQAVCSALGTLVVARTTADLLGARAGFAAALLLSLSAQAIFYPMYFLPAVLELLTAALSLSTLSGAMRRGGLARWAWAGVALGLAFLARPNIAAAGLVLIAVSGIARRPPPAAILRPALAFAAAGLLTLAPLAARNFSVAGTPGLLPTSGEANFKIGNSEDSLVAGFGYPSGPPLPLFSFAMFRHQLAKFVCFFWGYEIPQNVNYYIVREGSTVLSLPLVGLELMVALAAVGALTGWRRPGMRHVIVWTVAYAFSISAFFIVGRFRVPALPGLAVLATVALVELVERFRAGRRLAVAGMLSLGTFLLLSGSELPKGPNKAVRPNDYLNVMQASWARDRPAAVVDIARRAVRDYPQIPDMHALYGATLTDAGNPAALGELDEALKQDPTNARALYSMLAYHANISKNPQAFQAVAQRLRMLGLPIPQGN